MNLFWSSSPKSSQNSEGTSSPYSLLFRSFLAVKTADLSNSVSSRPMQFFCFSSTAVTDFNFDVFDFLRVHLFMLYDLLEMATHVASF